MSPTTYFALREKYKAILSALFLHVVIPAEAVGKESYGDIDYLVCVPRGEKECGREELMRALGAVRTAVIDNTSRSYAVRREECVGDGVGDGDVLRGANIGEAGVASDGETETTSKPLSNGYSSRNDSEEAVSNCSRNTYTQLDIHVLPHPSHLPWSLFKSSHGDLPLMLGTIIRPAGLTSNHTGLYARIPEIERSCATHSSSAKNSMLHLTSSPNEALRFLGLDDGAYERGFKSEEDVFVWLSRCRFFNREIFERSKDGEERANDRARAKKRGMYRRFVSEWVPAHPEVGGGKSDGPGRAGVLEEAMEYFGKQEEYRETLARYGAEVREKAFWQDVAAALGKFEPKGEALNLAIRALKRWVRFEISPGAGGGEKGNNFEIERKRVETSAVIAPDRKGMLPVVSTTPELDARKQPVWTVGTGKEWDALLGWITEHWVEIVAKEKDRVKSEATMRRREREAEQSVTPCNMSVVDQSG